MIRRLTLLIAVALGLFAPGVFGLGLGELELNSALNQRFDAEIELTNVGALEITEILPNLASQDDFNRVGVERNYLLTDLRFNVRTREDGQLVVAVTSNKPIIEPFLNFIVEVLWPTGRILREYTVLLDPPVFGEDGIEAVQMSETTSRANQAAATPAPTERATAAPRTGQVPSRPQVVAAEPEPTASRQEGLVSGNEYGMTGAGDTLWTIALKVRPDRNVTVQQTMLALQRANPDAFINGNINLLKAGHVLRIPDAREITNETPGGAVQEVKFQNEQYQAYRSGELAQLDAGRRQTAPDRASAAEQTGELKLVASSRSSGDRAGSGGDDRSADLENELAVAKEDLDRARRANSEMNVRLEDLESQTETLNQIVKLKDDQLAALRAEVQRMQAEGSLAEPAPTAAPSGGSDSLLANPLVLGGLGVLLVGGLAGGLIFMRRRQQDDDDEEEVFVAEALEEEAVIEEPAEVSAIGALEDDDEDDDEDVSPETNDVISEVEIYIAYGRFPQAITFLQNAIEAEPDRSDIQLKLLEVYVQTEDSTAFNLQLEQLKLLGDQDAIIQALGLQQKIPGAAETAAAAMDATVISSEPIEAIAEPDYDDDDELSFDLDDLDTEDAADDMEDGELDLSDELELDEADDLELDLDDSDDLELDLGDAEDFELDDDELELDLNDAEDLTAEVDSEEDDELTLAVGDDDLELDLDFDLDDEADDDLSDAASNLDGGLELDTDEESVTSAQDETILLSEDEIDLDLDLDDDDVLDLSDLDDDDSDLDAALETAALETAGGDAGGADNATVMLSEGEIDLSLDDDDDLSLDLSDDDELSLELDDEDDALSLDLGDDDEISLDMGDDDEIDLGLLDDEEISLDLEDLSLDDDEGLDLGEDDGNNKLDLARAYIDMGDSDGARGLLQEVVRDGSDTEIQEANDLLERIV